MAPRFKILMSSGSKKGTQIYFFFSLKKVPPNERPPGSPTGPLWKEIPIYRAFFFTSLETIVKIPLNKNFFLLSKALRKQRPSVFPKSGALWKQTPISRALRNISFGVPSKGALPPCPSHGIPCREMPCS